MNPRLWSLPARVPVKLFFAIRPDDAAGAAIENLAWRLKHAHRLEGRPMDRARLHNTLAAVHDTGTLTDNIRRAKSIGDRLWQRSFSVRFDWTASFQHKDNRYPFVLRGEDGATPLSDFRAALRTEMLLDGFAVERGFTPHVTLLWADRRVDEDYPVAPIAWTVRDFVLTASLQGQSHHIEVARWCLR
jgi:2'-5' RNA ligase